MAGADTGIEVSSGLQSIMPIMGNLPESLWITCMNKIALFSQKSNSYEVPPHQGLFEARRVMNVFLEFW
jgi:hypothetical protein